MYDIFLSYSSRDSGAAQLVVSLLKRQGLSVFFDRESIPSVSRYRETLREEVTEARLVVVLWSRHSVSSRWVIEEAEVGLKQNKLLQVFLDNSEVPFGFGQLQGLDMKAWNGSSHTHPLVLDLLDAIAESIDRPVTDRKRLEELAVVEKTEFTQKWMLALRTERADSAFPSFVRPALRSISAGSDTWNPLVFVSYMWFLEEILYAGRFSEELWHELLEIVLDDSISELVRRPTLYMLPRVHSKLEKLVDLPLPAVFNEDHDQLVYAVVCTFFEASSSGTVSLVTSRPLDVLAWLWSQSSDEVQIRMFLMIGQCLKNRGWYTDEINDCLLDENAYEDSQSFSRKLVEVRRLVVNQMSGADE